MLPGSFVEKGSCAKPLEMAQWAALRTGAVLETGKGRAQKKCNRICRESLQNGGGDVIEVEEVENGAVI